MKINCNDGYLHDFICYKQIRLKEFLSVSQLEGICQSINFTLTILPTFLNFKLLMHLNEIIKEKQVDIQFTLQGGFSSFLLILFEIKR